MSKEKAIAAFETQLVRVKELGKLTYEDEKFWDSAQKCIDKGFLTEGDVARKMDTMGIKIGMSFLNHPTYEYSE